MRLWVGLVALMIMLAGCTGAEDEPEEPTSTSTGTSTGTQTETGTQTTTDTTTSTQTTTSTGTPDPQSRPPAASLQVSEVDGTAPLQVNLTVDGEDPDGDLSAWSLDLGDGTVEEGQEFPAELNHTYTADGNYTLNLTVTDATGLTGSAVATITVAAGTVTALSYTIDLDQACPQCTAVGTGGCIERQTGLPTGDCKFQEVPASFAGAPFLVESTGGDPDLLIWKESCGSGEFESFESEGSESGTLPESEFLCFLVWEYMEAPSTVTIAVG